MIEGSTEGGVVLQRIARRVREMRTRQHLTQEAVAAGARLAVRHLQKVEAGEVNITVRSLVRIASALDVDVSELLRPDDADGHS
ncbi:MAG: helix-turn-helix transcriptional regulator [Chloroflexota bacterium]